MKLASLALATLVALSAPMTLRSETGKEWTPHMGSLKFVVGYSKGVEQARKDKKLVMLDFTTTWCGWCKKLASESFTDAEVVKALDGFTCVIVDGDVEKDICQKYGVRGFPNVRFVTTDDKELGVVGGYKPTAEFLAVVKSAIENIDKK